MTGRTAPSGNERCRTRGNVGARAAQCFHALSFAPGVTTVASSRVRARVRAFFEKKKRKTLGKDFTAAPYLLDKTNATRRQAGGWTKGRILWRKAEYDRYEFARPSSTSQCENVHVSRSSFPERQRPWTEGKAEERKSRSQRSIDPIKLLTPPLPPPSRLLTHSSAHRAKLLERYNVLCV